VFWGVVVGGGQGGGLFSVVVLKLEKQGLEPLPRQLLCSYTVP